MRDKEPRRGRTKVVGSRVVAGTNSSAVEAVTVYDPNAITLPDELARLMMQDPSLVDLVRKQRPDLFKD